MNVNLHSNQAVPCERGTYSRNNQECRKRRSSHRPPCIQIVALLMTLGAAAPGRVSAVPHPYSVAEKVALSDLVAEGQVLSFESQWNVEQTDIYTTARLLVSQIYKGEVEGDTLELSYSGGKVGDFVSGQEEGVVLQIGETLILYARWIPNIGYWVDSLQWLRPYDSGNTQEVNAERDAIRAALEISSVVVGRSWGEFKHRKE